MAKRLLLQSGLAMSCLLVAVVARADTGAEQRAAKLFDQGRTLARDGRCREAIPLLLESVKEAPGVGALLNLGHCHADLGKTFNAYQYFVRAGELARARRDERAAEAEERARALETKLSDLTVRVVDPSEPGLALRLDDLPLDRPQWNVARRVDPGEHVLAASSPRRGTVSMRVVIGSNADHAELVVPALAPPVVREEGAPSSTQRTVGWVVGGVGASAVATGLVFGLLSALDHSKLVDQCPSYPTCPPSRRADVEDLNDAARTKGTVSTVAVAAGLALVVGGAVLVLTGPRAR